VSGWFRGWSSCVIITSVVAFERALPEPGHGGMELYCS